MSAFENARIYAWYKLRRKTRKYRNNRVLRLFDAAVAKLQPGDVCFDCGANVGVITSRLAATGATVHAFEPDPDAYRTLEANVGRLANVVLHKAAVGVCPGQLALYRGAADPKSSVSVSVGSTLIGSKKNVTSAETILVDVIDLGTMIADFPQRISLLKIDIEGAEVDVMNSLLDRGVDAKVSEIFVETHEKQIPELRGATMKLLKRCRPYPNLHLDWW
jgi:FkbM family methyltransferase